MIGYLKEEEIPPAPAVDYESSVILNTFYFVARSRNISVGISQPIYLKLTVKDITDVVDAHDVCLPRSLLDPCIFAIDDIFLERANKIESNADGNDDDNTE